MDKKQFEKYKRILITVIGIIFITQKSVAYFKEKKETNEIVFYTLPAQEELITEKEQSEIIREIPETTVIKVKENEGLININTASSEELQTLYRIGPALAGRIIEYRESYGNFETKEEIMEVKGIGEKTYERIKDFICVN
jgi:comEA protein